MLNSCADYFLAFKVLGFISILEWVMDGVMSWGIKRKKKKNIFSFFLEIKKRVRTLVMKSRGLFIFLNIFFANTGLILRLPSDSQLPDDSDADWLTINYYLPIQKNKKLSLSKVREYNTQHH